MKKRVLVEGGQTKGRGSNAAKRQARAAFSKLFERAGLPRNQVSVEVHGGRGEVWRAFQLSMRLRSGPKPFMLIDSEQLLQSDETPWHALRRIEQWTQLKDAEHEQVLFMTTCMETWLVADPVALSKYFGEKFDTASLPNHFDIEQVEKTEVLYKLRHAARNSTRSYEKGKCSFELLELIDPETLAKKLSHFRRAIAVLGKDSSC